VEGLSAFAAAFILVGLLELGDKTQLLLISLATKHRPLPLIAGAAIGETAVTAIGVGIGVAIIAVIPILALKLVSGALFIVVGLWNLLAKDEKAEDKGAMARDPFLSAIGLSFLAELGDKTMLAVIALSGSLEAPVSVFVGGSLALLVVAIVSVALGRILKRYVTARWLRYVSAALFIGAGIIAIVEALWP